MAYAPHHADMPSLSSGTSMPQGYIPRHAETSIARLASMFGAVLVTGARQVGKSTLLEHYTKHIVDGNKKLTLDNAAVLEAARKAPETFFAYNTPPLFIDEIQKAPELFPEMKIVIDSTRGKGLLYLSGSEQFEMMAHVTESLAGRIGILTLMGLSLREMNTIPCSEPFLPSQNYFAQRLAATSDDIKLSPSDVWHHIHRGSMPELTANPQYDWAGFYGSYVRTYLERDVRRIAHIGDDLKFQSFMTVVAARSGQLLNLADIASNVGISATTAQRWLSILIASHIVYLLRPYYTNHTKRAIKTPKLYLTDTGLVAYLTRWNTPEALREGAMAGQLFETFVVAEILKSYYNRGILDPPLYYYRDKDKREIDLLIESNGCLHPLEIKKAGVARSGDTNTFRLVEALPGVTRGSGGVICLAENLMPLSAIDATIPVSLI